jgi:hypothetical protein
MVAITFLSTVIVWVGRDAMPVVVVVSVVIAVLLVPSRPPSGLRRA